jgi:hypothetical protein
MIENERGTAPFVGGKVYTGNYMHFETVPGREEFESDVTDL